MRLSVGVTAIALLSCAGPAPLAPLPKAPQQLATASPSGGPAKGAAAVGASSPLPATASGASATASEPLPPPAPPAAPSGEIGGPGPVELALSSPSGAWVALCAGEPKTLQLVLGAGPGEPIDDVLARDPVGRYVVTARAGVAQLVDADSGVRLNLTELGADVRRARADYAEHRTLSFDASGRYFAYLRRANGAVEIAVRELATGSERLFATGAGDVFRLQLSADARYVTFEALRDDTNKNGKLDWPAPEEQKPAALCDQPALPKFRSFGYQARGDALTRAVVSLSDGVVRDVPELVTPLGASLLVRESDGALRLEQAGKRAPLAPASCAGHVLFADAERGLVLASCTPPPPKKPAHGSAPAATVGGKRDVWLFGAGFAKDLQSELYETSGDREAVVGVRLLPFYPGSSANLLDLERRELLPLPAGSRVVTSRGTLALIWRDSDLYSYDAQAKTETRLAHGVSKNPDLLAAGSSVLLTPFVVVGAAGPALPAPANTLALSSAGFLLLPSSDAATAPADGSHSSKRGPLRWVDAKLGAPDGPPR